jgi:hypothetical protein
MKKLALAFLFVFAFCWSAQAADISTTFAWQQETPAAVISTDVFRGPTATGPWTMVKNQPMYTLGAGETEWKTTAAITVADNAQTTVYFKAQNIGANGLRSVDSNIISKTYDTRVAPSAPSNFTVK